MNNLKRRTVDLHRLPVGAQYAIAIAVSVLVAFLAWHIGRNRPSPAWIGPFMSVWLWLGPALLAFFLVAAVFKRIRKASAREAEHHPPGPRA
ncbi:MAG TPA: hypothetical protein VGL22_10860 [Terracidiphilus sp.]|jgi:Zn-dependent protease with chaperone function